MNNSKMIPYGKQSISQQDIDAVVAVLQSDFLTQGPQVPLFEKSLETITGAKHALAVNSATSALHLACLALGVGEGDLVWTTPITFVASANCALYCGATVDFVDIDPQTYNLSPAALAQKLADAKKNQSPLPKVVIPVHLCGQPCEMDKIYALSQEYGFAIIEDASHAIGGRYQDQPIGNCKYSNITVFSFHPVKIVTTAEGGAATTNNARLADKMALLRSHGVTRDPELMTEPSHGDWYYQQIALGYNYRMTDLQAALGVSQLTRLDDFVVRRRQLAARYDALLKDLPLLLPKQNCDAYSARHLYVIRLQLPEVTLPEFALSELTLSALKVSALKVSDLKLSHKAIFNQLRQRGIGVNLHYIPVHTQPYYQALGFAWGDFPEAEHYYQQAISLPLFPDMSIAQQDQVIAALSEVLTSTSTSV
ncbi:MAG: UDP-4-amino-4,6-dideoxy-N-acetyl-beta-L-altrosamine transaminase [Oleiphilaceae bacterium]|jgi:UDP-4-amino-4,6-dideoxy-N-acetyl-beta-L-altrosamine transaminase